LITVRRTLAVFALAVAVAILAALPAAAQTTTRCTALAVLQAGNEVMPPSTSQATGATLVRIDGTTVRFTTVIANPARETFILGHIHQAPAGVNGPIRVDLFDGPPSTRRLFTQFDTGTIRPPVNPADPPFNPAAICANPAGFYVNYHTEAFPTGAIRGQLTRLF
jgi:hypothetical protein